ncbi:hypothetical protein ACN47A_31400 [Myxococcus fulvus]|uniref:hypothetical protein n=1 Tax=Myxococcus fulvus TaxID=33 RepID=UPI003B9CBB80
MEPKTSQLQTVLGWPLPQVRTWLDGLVIGASVQGESFNWVGFAFTAAARAREERSLGWAHVALHVYGVLADQEAGDNAHSIRLSEMSLRAWMIRELGALEGDAVLDPDVIHAWFQRLIVMSMDEAAKLLATPDWRTIPTQTLLQLRHMKSALNTLAHIADSGVVERHPELKDWLQFRSRLP